MSGAVPLEIPVHILELDRWVDLACAIDAVAREPFPAVLDSSDPDAAGPRQTVLACRPVRILEATFPGDADPFEQLAALTRRYRITAGEATSYLPGWIGYFGYEAGHFIEELPDREAKAKKDALYQAGKIALALKNVDAAETHLTQLAELDFTYEDVSELLDKVAELRENGD